MMNFSFSTWQPITAFFLFTLIGYIRTTIRLRKLNKEEEFVFEYGKNFKEYLESEHNAKECSGKYYYLQSNVDKIQNISGFIGVYSHLRIPYQGVYQNYPIFLNEITKVEEGRQRAYSGDQQFSVNSIQNALIRLSGNRWTKKCYAFLNAAKSIDPQFF